MNDFDFEAGIIEARRRGFTTAKVLEAWGARPARNMRCPFCREPGKRKSAGVFAGTGATQGIEFFKCFHTSCPTDNKGLSEVMVVQQFTGQAYGPARLQYLKMAGVPEALWGPARKEGKS